ncbi:uncharacterized protein LOC108150000 isoform X2 [Drosophila elegans]|uniref:uncharacterized protein LOC108150000 isoform X2 n=1 Tax=Drosophila elegans TaxID=30023 RepID=UPI0007E8AD6A|nr:uncharacterized protein LOC108150000 isoform X2 [Drosophila elegans]
MSSSDPDDIPGTSKALAKKGSPPSSSSSFKSQASPLPMTSNGHGSGSGATPTGGPSSMELSGSEQDDTTTSSSSPQMNGHHQNDSGESDLQNGGAINGTPRRRKRRLSSGDTALMGWSGGFPKLKAMTSIDNSLDLEPQENDVEMEQPEDKQQQQQSVIEIDDDDEEAEEEEEEELEPLVVAENEGSPMTSASPGRRFKTRKRLFSSNGNKTNEEEEEEDEDEAEVPMAKSPKSTKTDGIILTTPSRFAKRAKSLNVQNSSAAVQLRRAQRFSSQDQTMPIEVASSTAINNTAKVPEPELKPEPELENKPEPKNEPKPDAQIEAIPEKLSTTVSALKLKATDEFYRLPFAYGWKRELVLPSSKNHKRRTGDVFFIAPNGRKLRSREDIVPLLTGELTIEHFCFQRLAQGAPPEHELVRRAMPSNAMLRKTKQQSMAHPEPTTPLPITGKRVSKPKVPKGASPPSEGWTATMAVKGNSRVLANSNGSGGGGANAAGTSLSSKFTRKRGFMPRQSRVAAIKIANCVYCQTPLPSGSKQGSLKTNTCQSCMKIKREKERESERSEFDDDPDDEDNASVGSLLEIGEEIKVPGQHPPAQLFNDLTPRRALREQEVVVVAGRKAIAIQADLPRSQVKLLPRQPDLSGYDQIYNKRRNQIYNKSRQDLMESMADAHNGCQVLMAIMKTMNLKERMNMSRVCKTWAMVGRENGVWRSVSLRDTYIQNWVFCLRELARHRTRELDMMGVMMANPQLRMTGDMRVLRALRVLRTDASDAEFISLAIRNLPQLLELRATCVSRSLNLMQLDKLTELRVLRIHMTEPKATVSSLNLLAKLKHLTELSLRGVTNLGNLNMLAFKELPRLEVLSLGSCQDVKCEKLGREVLPSLKALRSFRLENDHKGMAMFPVDDIMRGLSLAGGVRRLELINVDLDGGFSPLLASCATISDVLLIPKCMHNTANMTNAVMQAISDNAEQLKVFRLGLVTQLLSATGTLYRGSGKDVIPVRRPVPGIPDGDHLNHCSAGDSCQELDHGQCVAFLPVERLEAILHHMMPQAWLSVAKVAMCDTTKLKFLPRPEESSDEKF